VKEEEEEEEQLLTFITVEGRRSLIDI